MPTSSSGSLPVRPRPRCVDFLGSAASRVYFLAELLASFTRVASGGTGSGPAGSRGRGGSASLTRYGCGRTAARTDAEDPDQACTAGSATYGLLLASMFPDYAAASTLGPLERRPLPAALGPGYPPPNGAQARRPAGPRTAGLLLGARWLPRRAGRRPGADHEPGRGGRGSRPGSARPGGSSTAPGQPLPPRPRQPLVRPAGPRLISPAVPACPEFARKSVMASRSVRPNRKFTNHVASSKHQHDRYAAVKPARFCADGTAPPVWPREEGW